MGDCQDPVMNLLLCLIYSVERSKFYLERFGPLLILPVPKMFRLVTMNRNLTQTTTNVSYLALLELTEHCGLKTRYVFRPGITFALRRDVVYPTQ